jgi:hypothetical protein
MNTVYIVLILIIIFFVIYYLGSYKTPMEEKLNDIIKENYKSSEELLLALFYIRKNLYLKILISNNNIKSEDDYDSKSYIEIINGIELILITVQKIYKDNSYEYIINLVANMTYNIFYNNNIVKNAIKKNKFLISCEKDNIYSEQD